MLHSRRKQLENPVSELESKQPGRRSIWPEAALTLGISLTLAWAIVIGYGLVRLVEYVI